MKTKLTLSQVKEIYGENCYETKNSFRIRMLEKHYPDVTFVLWKRFDIGEDSKPINPLTHIVDSEMADGMGLDFDGVVSFMFGNFWYDKKNEAYFHPESPILAKHLFVSVKYPSGHTNETRKVNKALYFYHTDSMRYGYDYWIIPIGSISDADHEYGRVNIKSYRFKHANHQRKVIDEANDRIEKKTISEDDLIEDIDKLFYRLIGIDAELAEFRCLEKVSFQRFVDEILLQETREKAKSIAEEELSARNMMRIHNLLAKTELPRNLWFLFDSSHDLDSVICQEVEAIVTAAKLEKDKMDIQELLNCGHDRRCAAIHRMIRHAGGSITKSRINEEFASMELARFIAK